MTYSPPQTNVPISCNTTTNALMLTWTDGHKYGMAVAANDALVQTSTSTQIQFFYDVTAPTVTLQVPAISTIPASPSWLNAVPTFSGADNDNIIDIINTRSVFIRITQDGAYYLRPTFTSYSTNATQFEVGVSTDWVQVQTTAETWSLNTAA